MKDKIKFYGIILGILAVIALAFLWEVNIWNECRETNSFWYCVRVVSR